MVSWTYLGTLRLDQRVANSSEGQLQLRMATPHVVWSLKNTCLPTLWRLTFAANSGRTKAFLGSSTPVCIGGGIKLPRIRFWSLETSGVMIKWCMGNEIVVVGCCIAYSTAILQRCQRFARFDGHLMVLWTRAQDIR